MAMDIIQASRLAHETGKGFKRKGWCDYTTLQGPAPGAPTYNDCWAFPDRVDPKWTPEDFEATDWQVEGMDEENGQVVSYWYVAFSWGKGAASHGYASRFVKVLGPDGDLRIASLRKQLEEAEKYLVVVILNFARITRTQYEDFENYGQDPKSG